jgi:beta-galactosidase
VLSELAGVTVEEYGKQNAPAARPLWVFLPKDEIQTEHWYEVVQPVDEGGAEVLATWKGRHLDEQPAISLRRVGQGAVIYAGSYLTEDLLAALLPQINELYSIPKIWPFAPEGVQVSLRKDAEKAIWFFNNTSEETLSIEKLPGEAFDLVRDAPAAEPLVLEPNGVAIIQTTNAQTPAI